MDVAWKLDGSEVDDADGVAGVGGPEANAERVEISIVGEDLEELLGVVRGTQQLDPGVQLSPVRLQHDLELLGIGA